MDLEGRPFAGTRSWGTGATSARTTRVQILAELRPPVDWSRYARGPPFDRERAVATVGISTNVATNLRLAALSLAWPVQVDAQIYAWRDAAGNLVLSDRRLDAAAVTYAVPDAPPFRDDAAGGGPDGRARAFRALGAGTRSATEPAARPGASGDSGGIGLQSARPLTQRGDGADAADAGDGEGAGRRTTPTTLARTSAAARCTCGNSWIGSMETRSSPWPPTTPDRTPSIGMAGGSPLTGKPGTTCERSARPPSSGTRSSPLHTRDLQDCRDHRRGANGPLLRTNARPPARTRSSTAEVQLAAYGKAHEVGSQGE